MQKRLAFAREIVSCLCGMEVSVFELQGESWANFFRNNIYRNLLPILSEVIYACCDAKRQVVEEDELDTGRRMILNFGHTLGHSIEKYYNYHGFSHGKAVSVGMYLMTVIGEKAGLIKDNISDELKACLIANNMPYESETPASALFGGAVNDKKRFSDTISIILCREIGKADIVKMNINEFKEIIGG